MGFLVICMLILTNQKAYISLNVAEWDPNIHECYVV